MIIKWGVYLVENILKWNEMKGKENDDLIRYRSSNY